MILVDTSAWIDFFRDRLPAADRVDQALEENLAAICGPVVSELRRGFRSRSERATVLPLLDACHHLSQPQRLWEEAGDSGYTLARKGLTVKSFDLLIAAYALSHEVTLLASDEDFALMRKAGIPLRLLRP